ncbi:hypothetical protein [Pedobacter sp.]|uniref:hypothetical protein n=1 Tax=Pedobacter sp. TaxID=1411316 RepID=UPI003D7FE8F0
MIDINDFKQSINDAYPPAGLPSRVQALWHDGAGDWKKAHDLIDQETDKSSAHIHAYLHRKEGDLWNADYWYKRAGRIRPQVSLAEEWNMLVQEYLQ